MHNNKLQTCLPNPPNVSCWTWLECVAFGSLWSETFNVKLFLNSGSAQRRFVGHFLFASNLKKKHFGFLCLAIKRWNRTAFHFTRYQKRKQMCRSRPNKKIYARCLRSCFVTGAKSSMLYYHHHARTVYLTFQLRNFYYKNSYRQHSLKCVWTRKFSFTLL